VVLFCKFRGLIKFSSFPFHVASGMGSNERGLKPNPHLEEEVIEDENLTKSHIVGIRL
jgi:hypothetical protein